MDSDESDGESCWRRVGSSSSDEDAPAITSRFIDIAPTESAPSYSAVNEGYVQTLPQPQQQQQQQQPQQRRRLNPKLRRYKPAKSNKAKSSGTKLSPLVSALYAAFFVAAALYAISMSPLEVGTKLRAAAADSKVMITDSFLSTHATMEQLFNQITSQSSVLNHPTITTAKDDNEESVQHEFVWRFNQTWQEVYVTVVSVIEHLYPAVADKVQLHSASESPVVESKAHTDNSSDSSSIESSSDISSRLSATISSISSAFTSLPQSATAVPRNFSSSADREISSNNSKSSSNNSSGEVAAAESKTIPTVSCYLFPSSCTSDASSTATTSDSTSNISSSGGGSAAAVVSDLGASKSVESIESTHAGKEVSKEVEDKQMLSQKSSIELDINRSSAQVKTLEPPAAAAVEVASRTEAATAAVNASLVDELWQLMQLILPASVTAQISIDDDKLLADAGDTAATAATAAEVYVIKEEEDVNASTLSLIAIALSFVCSWRFWLTVAAVAAAGAMFGSIYSSDHSSDRSSDYSLRRRNTASGSIDVENESKDAFFALSKHAPSSSNNSSSSSRKGGTVRTAQKTPRTSSKHRGGDSSSSSGSYSDMDVLAYYTGNTDNVRHSLTTAATAIDGVTATDDVTAATIDADHYNLRSHDRQSRPRKTPRRP